MRAGGIQPLYPIAITPRDVRLLSLMQIHVLLSFGQIQRFVFGGRSHPTILNRLKRLEVAGLILRHRIHRIRHPMFSQDIGVVFQVTPKGLVEIQKYQPERALPEKMPALHGRQLDHDLLTVEVAEGLRSEFRDWPYASGAFLEAKKVGEQRPDGTFQNPQTRRHIAIEVELTMKSSDRYREICSSYRVDSRFERVIFFAGSMAIARRIMRELKGYDVETIEGFKDSLFEFRLIQAPKQMSGPVQTDDLGGVA